MHRIKAGYENTDRTCRLVMYVLLGMLILPGAAWAGDIAGEAGIAANSVLNPSTGSPITSYYHLDAGTHNITWATTGGNGINIFGGTTAQNIKVDNPNTVLNVDNTAGISASALLGLRDFTLGSGTVTAVGGNGNAALGIQAENFIHSGSGSIITVGGNGDFSKGIYTTDFTHSGSGSITASGGIGNSSTGIYINDFTHSGSGSITASGGIGNGSPGIQADNFIHSGSGSIITVGGNGDSSKGIYITDFTHSGSGSITASGGIGNSSTGIYINDFTHSGSGSITASGGNGDKSYGISIFHDFTHSGSSSITASGGNGDDSYGISIFHDFTHSGSGSIITVGGNGDSSFGIIAQNFDHSGTGLITAAGGYGQDAYGLAAYGNMTVTGALRTSRLGNAASVYVNDWGSGLSFGSAATLIPVVNLDNTDSSKAAGLVQIHKDKDAVIASGALLQPEIRNSWALGAGSTRNALFLQIGDGGVGVINGEFTMSYASPTIGYSLRKSPDRKNYYFSASRLMTPGQAVPLFYDGPNTSNLFNGLQAGLPFVFDPFRQTLGDIFTGADNQSFAAFADYVNQAQLGLTPHDTTRLAANILRQSSAGQDVLDTNIALLARYFGMASPITMNSSTTAMASLQDCSGPRNHFWLSPMYQQSMHIGSGGREFYDSQEKFGGAALGYARGWDKLVLGGQLHYIRGKAESITSTTDSDFYGVTLGGRFHNFFDPSRSFKPFIDFSAGYSYGDYDMDRLDYSGMISNSSPHAHVYRAGLYLGSDYSFCGGRILLSPKSGADYVHVDQSGFDESGWSPYLLHVDGARFNSLRFKSGLDAQFRITDKLSATGAAFYKYECLDRNSSLRSQFLNAPSIAFDTEGYERNRISGELGAGLNYRASEKVSLSAGYNLYLEDRYLAHQVNATLGVNF